MKKIVITGEIADDFFQFVQLKIPHQQKKRKEKKDLELSFRPRFQITDHNRANADLLNITFEIIKDIGVEVLAGLIVEFLKRYIKIDSGKGSTSRQPEKRLRLKKSRASIEINATNYSVEEIRKFLAE